MIKNIIISKTVIIMISLFILVLVITTGCSDSSKETTKFNRSRNIRQSNLTTEQIQQMRELRLEFQIKACENKSETDICTLQNPRINISGICQYQNETLLCTTNKSFYRN